ncbi:hypothetical protein QYE73_22720 [Pseudomonas mosselii]|uniref:hypothetical protein n=1 Tax=Pseudomonas mosselii TaxID=78327 RepID=UPI00260B6B3A|nr:hypothetical protein [Pseudomonas mosselii]MDN4500105.1 hypothetical protein [Pseudomonas mosselii]
MFNPAHKAGFFYATSNLLAHAQGLAGIEQSTPWRAAHQDLATGADRQPGADLSAGVLASCGTR